MYLMPYSHEVAAIGTTTATEPKSYGGVGPPKNAESATEHWTTATRFEALLLELPV
jgi:hypothetical protein